MKALLFLLLGIVVFMLVVVWIFFTSLFPAIGIGAVVALLLLAYAGIALYGRRNSANQGTSSLQENNL